MPATVLATFSTSCLAYLLLPGPPGAGAAG
jgi:hypothetical protein